MTATTPRRPNGRTQYPHDHSLNAQLRAMKYLPVIVTERAARDAKVAR